MPDMWMFVDIYYTSGMVIFDILTCQFMWW